MVALEQSSRALLAAERVSTSDAVLNAASDPLREHEAALDRQFRTEVRAFLAAELTEELREAGRSCSGVYCERPIAQRWLSILNDRGWAVPSWPAEWGGTGWTAEQQYIFDQELTLADAPPVTPNATGMVGPVIIAFGTDEQKARYLPRIRSGEDWWAQGYSEPGAGSDLASLQCRAVRDGNEYIINGTKIWTTHAHWSNRIFCLVRTSTTGKPQAGISFLLFDMATPGISVRPIISMSGDHELNQVFFDDVRVPVTSLLGKENDGWTVAKYLLAHERSHQYSPLLRGRLSRLKRFAHDQGLLEQPHFRRKLAEVEVELHALEATERRMQAASSAGNASDLVRAAQNKVLGSELRQRLTEIAVEALGNNAVPWQPMAGTAFPNNEPVGSAFAATSMGQYLNDRAASIYAGSNEVQRNIIASQLLKG
jgi:alkylation response protein AidB-like acyl-CoA dehydrogenase